MPLTPLVLALAVLGAPRPAASLQDAPPAGTAETDPQARWEALEERFQAAHEEWSEALAEAEGLEERALNARHPARAFLDEADELAEAGVGPARLFLVEHLRFAELPAGEVGPRRLAHLERLLAEHADAPWITGLDASVWSLYLETDPARSLELLGSFVEETANDEAALLVGAALASAVAGAPAPADHAERAALLLDGLLARGPKRDLAERMEGLRFRLRHLRIGERVPDFGGVGPDGEELRLSDLDGRVVVLEFWGFW